MTAQNATLVDERIHPAYKIAVITRALNEIGISSEAALANTGLLNDDLYSPTTLTSLRQLEIVFRNAITLSDDPTIALRAGQHVHITCYGMYGYALLSSNTLRDALEFSIRYHELATPTARMELLVEGEEACFMMNDRMGWEGDLLQFNIEFQLSLVHSLFHDVIGAGQGFSFSRVCLTYSPPSYSSRYQAILGCPVDFDQLRNELRFSKHWLQESLFAGNPITSELVTRACDQELDKLATQSDTVRSIFGIFMTSPKQLPSIEYVANVLCITSRTLRRKLESQGTSYQKLVNTFRKQLALRYLRDTRMSVEDIAECLGFSDAANFRHAFKKWTNRTPSSYR